MKKKLYYTVHKEDGFISVKMYSIINDTPEIITEIHDLNEDDNPVDFIQGYLDDNGLGDNVFDFIQL